MPSGLKQPVGQKRLTNIAVVRLRKAGAVFEIACYKNKVSNWRAEIETDLDEVLQTTAVFSNVSKGIMAKEKQLQTAFKTTDEEKICLEILAKGELQVSEKERKLEYDNLYKDVASIIAEKCIDPNTSRQYTATIIERALKDVHFNPDLKKSAKQQAFSEALPLLQKRFSIQRANMRVQLHSPMTHAGSIKESLHAQDFLLESSTVDNDSASVQFVCLIEPGMYRPLHQLIEKITQGTGRIELLNLAAVGDVSSTTRTPQARESSPSSDPLERGEEVIVSGRISGKTRAAKQEKTNTVYQRGSIAALPEDFARKNMFLEIDRLEEGWQVELTQCDGSDVIQATFYSPSGEAVGAYAKARRQALASARTQEGSGQSIA